MICERVSVAIEDIGGSRQVIRDSIPTLRIDRMACLPDCPDTFRTCLQPEMINLVEGIERLEVGPERG